MLINRRKKMKITFLNKQIENYNYKSVKKISFPMPTTKNQFQILNQHPKIHRKTKKYHFLIVIHPNFTRLSSNNQRETFANSLFLTDATGSLCFNVDSII